MAEPDGFGKVGDEDCGEQSDADAITRDQADAEHHLFGDSVEERTEGEPRPAVSGRRGTTGGPGGTRLVVVFDGTVGEVIGQRPEGEAKGDGVAAAEFEALLGEVKTDGTDQRSGTEGEHDTDRAVRPPPEESEQCADDQRRCGECSPPQRRRQLFNPLGPRNGDSRIPS